MFKEEEDDIHLEDGKPQAPQEKAPEPARQRPKRTILWIAILVAIVIAVGLSVGLVLGLDDDDDDDSVLHLQCLHDSGELLESPIFEEYETEISDEWIDCQFEDQTAYCDILEPEAAITEYTQLCEEAGGQIFTFDDAKLKCKAKIEGVGKVSVTMNFVSFVECFASSCEIEDDEAFERAAMKFIGSKVAEEDDEISECKSIN